MVAIDREPIKAGLRARLFLDISLAGHADGRAIRCPSKALLVEKPVPTVSEPL
jgi:hypothetical protein